MPARAQTTVPAGVPRSSYAEGGPGTTQFLADPYAFYAGLRGRGALHFFPDRGVWWAISHAGTVQVLTDRRFVKHRDAGELPEGRPGAVAIAAGTADSAPKLAAGTEGVGPGLPAGTQPEGRPDGPTLAIRGLGALPDSMLFLDPPDHTRLRALVNKAFTPTVVERLEPRIRALTNALLDDMAAGPDADLVADFAFPLPAAVIAELMGVPLSDRAQFREWSEAIALSLDVTQPAAVHERGGAATRELATYFADLLRERRRSPRPDLLSGLLAVEEQGDRLQAGELLAMCILLLVAGHETTKNLIANGTWTLLHHREATAALSACPERFPSAVEELLRFESPVQRTARVTSAEVTIAGITLPPGAFVVAVLGAANRDPAVFTDPERLDLLRSENPHVAFGRGIHFCLGAPLARLEGRVALETLWARFPQLEARSPTPDWSDNTLIRGLRSLPVRTGAMSSRG